MAIPATGVGIVVQECISMSRIRLANQQCLEILAIDRVVCGDRRVDQIQNGWEQVVTDSDLLAYAAGGDW